MRKLATLYLALVAIISAQSGTVTGMRFPEASMYPVGTLAFTSSAITLSGQKIAVVFQVPKTGNLWKVGYRTGTVSCTTCPQVIRVSFQDPATANGDPDGTQDQYRDANIADTDDNLWTTTGIISSDGTDTGALRAVTKGDSASIVWEQPNAFNVGDAFRVSGMNAATASFGVGISYIDTQNAGVWTKNVSSVLPNFVLYYDDGLAYYLPDVSPFSAVSSANYNSGTSSGSGGDERGLKFTLAAPVKCVGAWVTTFQANTSADFDLVLYASDGTTVLATRSFLAKVYAGAVDNYTSGLFPTPVVLSAQTVYYLTLKPTTTNNVKINFATVNANADLDQYVGGANAYYSVKTDGGAFTDTTTRRPMLGIIFEQIPAGASPSVVTQ